MTVSGARLRVARPAVGDTLAVAELDSAAARLRSELVDRGFRQAQARWDTSACGDGVAVRFEVAPGPRARLSGWGVVGRIEMDSARLARALQQRGKVFSRELVEQAADRVLVLYEEEGYPLCAAEVAAVAESAAWVTPTLRLDEGPRVLVDFLRVSGSTRTAAAVFSRTAGFRPKLRYSPRRLRYWRRGIERGGWAACDSLRLVEQDGAYGAEFWVTEGRSSRIGAALGYSTAERFTGFAQVRLLNILGTARQAEAGWQSYGGRTAYSVAYTEPWLFNTGVSIGGSAGHRVYDSTYAHTELALAAGLSPEAFDLEVSTGWEQVIRTGAGRVSTTWAGTGIGFDTRDRSWLPGRGVAAELRTRVGQRQALDSTAGAVGRVELDLSAPLTLAERLAWVNGAGLRLVASGAALLEPELYTVGGARSVRGYREAAYAARRAGWLRSELEYRFGRSGCAYPFVDAGAVDRGGLLSLVGYGVGGRWRAAFGQVEVDYGVAWGESPTRGKVHISFEGGF